MCEYISETAKADFWCPSKAVHYTGYTVGHTELDVLY